jgi:hypothetical protein
MAEKFKSRSEICKENVSISEENTATFFRVEDPNLFFVPTSVINLVLYEYTLLNVLVFHISFTKNLICKV